MKLNKKKNTIRNTGWGIINKGIGIFSQFIIRTIIIKILGAEYLGLNGLFTSILQVLNMTEMGFSSAMVFSMYKPIAEDDSDKICAIMSFYRKVYRIIGGVILSAGLFLVRFLPYLIHGEYPQQINIYILYLIYLFNTAISYFLFAYKNCLLTAHQREDVVSNVGTVTNLLQYSLQIGILCITKNYYLFIILQPIMTIVANVINAYFANKLYPQYVCKGQLEKAEIKEIQKQVGGLMIAKVSSTLRNGLDNIFLSAYLGLTIVSMYGNYYYVMSAIQGFLIILCNAMRAGIGNSIVLESKEKNHEEMLKVQFLYMWVTGWCTVCLLCLYQPFMELWVGKKLMFPNTVVILFCIYFYIMCQGDICSVYSGAIGLWWQVKKMNIVAIVMNLGLNWLLVYMWGVYGIIIATIISSLFLSLIMGIPYLYKFYFIGIRKKKIYKMLIYQILVTIVAGALTYFVCENYDMNFLIRIPVCIIIPNLLFVIMYMPFKEYVKGDRNEI